ncbi:hypothetical protein [Pasteurella multocida]|nr:hypothetical protein [Pasteurella multocida]
MWAISPIVNIPLQSYSIPPPQRRKAHADHLNQASKLHYAL